MTARIHKWLGALLLLPLLGWSLTGAIFLIKPGYGDAYTPLTPRYYSLQGWQMAQVGPAWEEFRLARTVLGLHLLARDTEGWRQYDPVSLTLRPLPAPEDVIRLLEDAITVDPDRYGSQVIYEGGDYLSETGVRLSLDWHTLALQQFGRDRALIDTLYNVHYLRWTGNRNVDNVLGTLSLFCLALTSLLGAQLLLRKRP
jgi:hypothetical protein